MPQNWQEVDEVCQSCHSWQRVDGHIITAMNTMIEILVLSLPFAAGAWAAWALPRWAGESPRPAGPPESDWSVDGLPSRPYAALERIS